MTPEKGYTEALRQIDEAKRKGAAELNLSDSGLTKIPVELLDCDALRTLNMSHNQISQLENLPQRLQRLTLRSNQISRIENLPLGLKELDLRGNQISRIESLPSGLELLYLRENQISRIENLPQGLQKLALSGNQISRIENLPQGLKELGLWGNQITRIENLPDGLKELNLRGNQISRIENLPDGLELLALWGNQISRIENLPLGLKELDLTINQISRIENLPDGLKELHLRENQISRIENLPQGLQKLTLSDNQISRLDGLSVQLLEKLELIYLQGNPIQDIPSNELDNKSAILGYLKSKQGQVLTKNIFLKLNIIGEGRIGKTQFLNFLRKKSYEVNAPETHGTNTTIYKIPKTEFQATIWDFGGQSYHHGFHKIFLGRTDFNVVLWRNHTQQKPDYGYWLGTARVFTSESQDGRYLYPLLLVQNVWRTNDSQAGTNFMPDEIYYPHSKQMADYQVGIDDVFLIDVKAIFDSGSTWQFRHHYFLEHLHQRMITHAQRYVVSQEWVKIKTRLDKKPVTKINLKRDEFRKNYSPNITDNDIFEGLLAYLAFTGNVLLFRENINLQDYIFPNPPALSDWLYNKVLDQSFKSKEQGKISWSFLKQKLKTDEKVKIFLELMLSFELIFEQPHVDTGDDPLDKYYIIPQFLPEYQHSFKQVLLDLLPFTFSLKFPDFIHEGQIFQFISTYGKHAKDNTAFWKYGLLYGHEINRNSNESQVQKHSNTLQVLVYYLSDKRQLLVHIEDKKGRSEVARDIFDYFVFDIKPSPEPQVLNGPQTLVVEQSEKLIVETISIEDEQALSRELNRSRAFENLRTPVHFSTQSPYFFDVTKTALNIKAKNVYGTCEETQQRVKLNFMAINLLSSDNSRKLRLFFSYSHKDEVYRNELETHLAMLKRSGRIETWYDRKIVAGEVWNEKIKEQMRQADIVLLMISADFLNSDYIWEHELGIVRERHQNQDGVRIIPIFTRPCDTKDLDFMTLQGGQRDHHSKLPWISSSPDRDQLYTDIVGEIRTAIEFMH